MTVELLSLKPQRHQRMIDLAIEAGIDVTAWANFKGGEAKAASNPSYCYEWCLEDKDTILLNLWHGEIEVDGEELVHRKNYRQAAKINRGVRRARAKRMDSIIQRAHQDALPVRVAILSPSKPEGRADLRLLDPKNWLVTSYNATNGENLIRRGVEEWVGDHSFDPETQQFSEGAARRRFIVHRHREHRLRQEKLKRFKEDNGRIFCEVPGCGFDFTEKYGLLGEDYAHVHHTLPLASAPLDGRVVTIDELAVVCPNCHAMIHRGGECRSISELSQSLLAATARRS